MSILIFILKDSCRVIPEWSKLDHKPPVVKLNSPSILDIKMLSESHAGIYVCKTTNHLKEPSDIGIKLDFDKNGQLTIKQLNEKALNAMINDTSRLEHELEDDEIDYDDYDYTEFASSRLPNIKISLSDKIALTKGERVEFDCETGA